MKILISAYACSPNMGSEPGMAWNWITNIAKHAEVYIITEGEFKDNIEMVLPSLKQRDNIHFYYNPVSEDVRKKCWNQGDWRFYKYYKKWQWKTYLIAKDICSKIHIDILHQLNMIGFREPGYLWKLSQETGIKFVWGPVDAKDKFPMAYTQGAGFKIKMKLLLKNFITCQQLRHSRRVRHAAETANVVFSASCNSVRSFKKYLGIDSILLNETGCSKDPIEIHKSKDKSTFDILWVGKMDFRKQLGLAIQVVAKLNRKDIKLHIVGGGDTSHYKEESDRLGISDNCVWYGTVSHSEVQKLMQAADLFLFTSVAEGTPHVVLEAIANHLPVACFDTCGQGDAVDDKVGFKIPLSTPERSVADFTDKIGILYQNKILLEEMSENCRQRQMGLSWDKKVEQFMYFLAK